MQKEGNLRYFTAHALHTGNVYKGSLQCNRADECHFLMEIFRKAAYLQFMLIGAFDSFDEQTDRWFHHVQFYLFGEKKASINTKGFVVILKVRQYESFYKTLKVVRTPPFVD